MLKESVAQIKCQGLDGITVNYKQGGKGTPVVFIHGFMSSSDKWTDIMTEFSKKHHVVALDLPGHGKTAPLPPSKTGIDGFAEVFHAFTEKVIFQEPSAIVADSMGAVILLQLLKKRGFLSKRLILSGCPLNGLPGWFFPLFFKGIGAGLLKMLIKMPPAISGQIISFTVSGRFNARGEAIQTVIRDSLTTDPATAETLLHEMKRPLSGLESSVFSGARVLAVRGERDHITSRNAGHRLARISRGQYIELAGCGHNIQLSHSRTFNDVVERFMKE